MADITVGVNYAQSYGRELALTYAYKAYFPELYGVANNQTYKIINANTIQIPILSTSGSGEASRTAVSGMSREYELFYETHTLRRHRMWKTTIHDLDITETNLAGTVKNIMQEHAFYHTIPEKDSYTISTLFTDWKKLTSKLTGETHEPNTEDIDSKTILDLIDEAIMNMSEARVPIEGSILYVTPKVTRALKNSVKRYATLTDEVTKRVYYMIDGVKIREVPSEIMQTSFTFGEALGAGYEKGSDAKQINMFMVHPTAVICPEQYTAARLDRPMAVNDNRYVFYEEHYEDAFILGERSDGLWFNVESDSTSTTKA